MINQNDKYIDGSEYQNLNNMSTENLHGENAVQKLRKMVDKIDIGMLCSNAAEEALHAIPMSRQEVDENGAIYFLFSSESDTYQNVQKNKNVSLLYSDTKNYNFLSINGTAEISSDRARIDRYWNKMMEAWFEKGKDDPTIRILKVTPLAAHYWDNKTNKLVTFFKVAANALTDSQSDIGRHGNLDL